MKKAILEELSKLLGEQISMLKEIGQNEAETAEAEEKTETLDIRSVGDNKTLTIDFENVSVKFKKLNSEYDFWIVIEGRESVQLKVGDIVQFVKADDKENEPASVIKKGKRLKMIIMRKTNMDYLSNPIQSWHS